MMGSFLKYAKIWLIRVHDCGGFRVRGQGLAIGGRSLEDGGVVGGSVSDKEVTKGG